MSVAKVNSIQNVAGTEALDVAQVGSAFGSGFGGKNKLINGGFDVWQRGVSNSTGIGTLMYLADRWVSAGTAITVEQITGLVHDYGLRTTADSAGDVKQRQKIEATKALANKTITITAQVLVSATATNCAIRLYDGDGAGVILSEPFTPTGSLQTVTATFNTGDHLAVPQYWTMDIISTQVLNGVMELHEVQLEEGSVATPFENKPIGVELALCQRYYQEYELSANEGYRGGVTAASMVGYIYDFPVEMRVVPTVNHKQAPTYENCSFQAVKATTQKGWERVTTVNTSRYRVYTGTISYDAEL